jgi:hypothetical protein
LPRRVQADSQRLQGPGRHSLALVDQAQQDVLGAGVVVAEHPGFCLRQDDNPPRPVGKPLEHLTAPSCPVPPWATLGPAAARQPRELTRRQFRRREANG